MKLEGSGSRVRHRRPAAIEEVPGAIRGVDLEMWQRGCELSDWSTVEAHLNHVVVLSGRMAAPFLAFGAADQTDLSFALRLAGDRSWTMNGHTMGAGDIALLGPRGELTSTTSGPVHWLALQISPEKLFRYSESIAGVGTYLKRGETHLLKPHVAQMDDLRCALTQAAELAAATPAVLSRPAVRHALEAQLMHALVCCLRTEPEPLRSHHDRVAQRAISYLREHDREMIYISDLSLPPASASAGCAKHCRRCTARARCGCCASGGSIRCIAPCSRDLPAPPRSPKPQWRTGFSIWAVSRIRTGRSSANRLRLRCRGAVSLMMPRSSSRSRPPLISSGARFGDVI